MDRFSPRESLLDRPVRTFSVGSSQNVSRPFFLPSFFPFYFISFFFLSLFSFSPRAKRTRRANAENMAKRWDFVTRAHEINLRENRGQRFGGDLNI